MATNSQFSSWLIAKMKLLRIKRASFTSNAQYHVRKLAAEITYGAERELASRDIDVKKMLASGPYFDTYLLIFDNLDAIRLPSVCAEQLADDCSAFNGVEVGGSNDHARAFNVIVGGDWIDEANCSGYVITTDGVFASEDDTFTCDRSGYVYSDNDDAVEVITCCHFSRTESEVWHRDQVDDHAFWCDLSEAWYSYDATSRVDMDSGDSAAEWYVQRNDYYYHERSDTWSSEPEYDEDEDEDEDEDDDGNRVYIPAYHAASRTWDYIRANRSSRAFYGFELEVDFSTRGERARAVSALVAPRNVVAERDGSLDDDTGVEFITRPLTFAELRNGNPLRTLCTELKNYSHNCPTGYGVHITANLGRLTDDHRKRFELMIVLNRPMSELVAGREQDTFYAYKLWELSNSKYCACRQRDETATEVRIFQGTTNYDVLMRYVEYVDAVTEWTRNPAAPIQNGMAAASFRRWVRGREDYPHLAAFFGGATTVQEEQPRLRRAA